MAVLIIDHLELIEIQHQHGTVAAVATAVGQLPIHIDAKTPLVVEGGERIVVGEELQLPHEMLAFGDVLDLHDQHPLHRTAVVIGRCHGHQPPGAMPIGMLEALLEGAGFHLAAEQPGDQVFMESHIVGMHQLRKRQALQLLLRATGEVRPWPRWSRESSPGLPARSWGRRRPSGCRHRRRRFHPTPASSGRRKGRIGLDRAHTFMLVAAEPDGRCCDRVHTIASGCTHRSNSSALSSPSTRAASLRLSWWL